MEKQMRMTRKAWLILLVILAVAAVIAAAWAEYSLYQSQYQGFPFRRVRPPSIVPGDIEFYYIARTVVSTVNVALLVVLIVGYVSIYLKTRSQFTIGLLIFALVFLMKDLTSSPFVTGAFGFQLFGLGPFALLPDLFELGALSILVYLSIRY